MIWGLVLRVCESAGQCESGDHIWTGYRTVAVWLNAASQASDRALQTDKEFKNCGRGSGIRVLLDPISPPNNSFSVFELVNVVRANRTGVSAYPIFAVYNHVESVKYSLWSNARKVLMTFFELRSAISIEDFRQSAANGVGISNRGSYRWLYFTE